MKNKLILISENLDLMQKVRNWVNSLTVEGGVQIEIFNRKGWMENLENPFLRAKLMDKPMLLPGLKSYFIHEQETFFTESATMSNVVNLPKSSPYTQVVPLDEIEKAVILQAIDSFKGNLSMVAKALKLGRATLYRKLKQYGISFEEIRTKSNKKKVA